MDQLKHDNRLSSIFQTILEKTHPKITEKILSDLLNLDNTLFLKYNVEVSCRRPKVFLC